MKCIGTKELETERLILRKVKVEDAPNAYTNWCSNENVAKYTLWEKHKNIEETKNLFKIWEEEYSDLKTFRWIVELKDSHDLIGTIDVPSKKFIDYGALEIGYCYSEKYWNKGYATEATKAVIAYGFEKINFHKVQICVRPSNLPSKKVIEKCGFTYEGMLRDYFYRHGEYEGRMFFSILNSEYESSKEA